MGAVSPHSYLPVRHKGCESLLTYSAIFIWPYQVVQARVWAQGLTLDVIIATGVLTHSQRAKIAQMRKVRVTSLKIGMS